MRPGTFPGTATTHGNTVLRRKVRVNIGEPDTKGGISGQLIVLLGDARRVVAGDHFSNAKRSSRKVSGSAAGVTGRSENETLS